MTDKQSWMEGFEAGMAKLAQLISDMYGAPKPGPWDKDDQALADKVWRERK